MPETMPTSVSHKNAGPEGEHDRWNALENLLGPDIEFAQREGLIDMFYYNPETGKDGLLHTLAGEVGEMWDGTQRASGWHHEGSTDNPHTRATEDNPENISSKIDAYRVADVAIRGVRKTRLKLNKSTGSFEPGKPTKQTMFPKGYDTLAALRAIRFAKDGVFGDSEPEIPPPARTKRMSAFSLEVPITKTGMLGRDREQDEVQGDRTKAVGYAPSLDGGRMEIRMILDTKTDKIITAYPVIDEEFQSTATRGTVRESLGAYSPDDPESTLKRIKQANALFVSTEPGETAADASERVMRETLGQMGLSEEDALRMLAAQPRVGLGGLFESLLRGATMYNSTPDKPEWQAIAYREIQETLQEARKRGMYS